MSIPSEYNLSNGFISDYIRNSYLDSRGDMWIATTRGVARFQQDKINFYSSGNGLANNYCYHLTEDRKGDIWITSASGLSLFDGSNFTTYSVENGLSSDRIEFLLPMKDGSLIVSTEGGLDIIKNREVSKLFTIQELKGRVISHMTFNRNDEIWCGTTDNGIMQLDINENSLILMEDLQIKGKITFLTFDHSIA